MENRRGHHRDRGGFGHLRGNRGRGRGGRPRFAYAGGSQHEANGGYDNTNRGYPRGKLLLFILYFHVYHIRIATNQPLCLSAVCK